MKCSFFKLFLMFGGLASAWSATAYGQYTGCGGYGAAGTTCPYQAHVEAAPPVSMSPWGLPNWLSVRPRADALTADVLPSETLPADGLPEAYAGCEAGYPVDAEGCAAAQSPAHRDVWTELYTRDCCPAAARDDASLATDAVTEPAEVSDLGCLAADERHSQGQSAVESLNQQQQGLSGTHLTVKLRVGPVAEDDEIVALPVPTPAKPVAVTTDCFDDEESCLQPHYDCYSDDCCFDEYDCYCHPQPVADDEVDKTEDCKVDVVADDLDWEYGYDSEVAADEVDDCEIEVAAEEVDCFEDCDAEVVADEAAPAVANRAVIENDPRARDFENEVFEAILDDMPLVPEITRQDLGTPTAAPWADEAIRQAEGKVACRGMLQGWAYMARCTGECLRSLSHSLSELADDIDTDDSFVQADDSLLPPGEDLLPVGETDDGKEAAFQSIPEEYLGW